MDDVFTGTRKKARDFSDKKTHDFESELETLRSDLSGVIDMVSRLGRDEGHFGARAGEVLDEAIRAGRKARDSARTEARGVEARLLSEIEAHPWRAVGVAALGGIALGWFIGRK
ncbi:DUF883 family protein [Acidimangrovimonas sediminis]|uniref:DUF883 family protein n=1 Tax=Acidimangrovimonas sediminis TaxID=2056283 RepID=UPI000C81037B|nr:hypothetical protein [Acidimangrovimonas sediminis]